MSKQYKVKRSIQNTRRKNKKRIRLSIFALLLVTCSVVGWFSFQPISDFFANIMIPVDEPPSSITSSSSQASSSEASSTAPTVVEPVQEGFPTATYSLSKEEITNHTLLTNRLSEIKADGGTAVMFELKDNVGLVHYNSTLPIFQANQTLFAETVFDLNALISTIKEAGLIPVASMYAFEDSTAPKAMPDAAVKYQNSQVNWIDDSIANGGKPWLNPSHQQSQDYMLQLVDEVSAMGVEHILLNGMQFPMGYSLSLATYGNTGELNKSTVLEEFLSKAVVIANSNNAYVYPVIRLDALVGLNDILYGDDAQKLVQVAEATVLDVRVELFGNGVSSDTLTISNPVQQPDEAISAALAYAMTNEVMTSATFIAIPQIAPPQQYNVVYTDVEISAQVQALNAMGIESIIYTQLPQVQFKYSY